MEADEMAAGGWNRDLRCRGDVLWLEGSSLQESIVSLTPLETVLGSAEVFVGVHGSCPRLE